MKKLLDLIHSGQLTDWSQRCQEAFNDLFGAGGGRFPEKARQAVSLRAPGSGIEVPFASLIHPSNPESGAYGGMSFVLFPLEGRPALITMVVGA